MNYIHHIVITVSDSKKSADFYQKVLDWEISEQKEDYAYLVPDKSKFPKCDFMLVLGEPREGKVEGGFNRNQIGLDHFAFQVETTEELKEVEERLRKHHIVMEEGGITDDDFGGTAIFCTDPDGMKVEFHLR
jgi:glyoxylase I family protein